MNIDIPDDMQPGHTVVVQGLGRLTLEWRRREKLTLRAAAIVRLSGKIICFKPTRKTVSDAMLCKGYHVAELKIIDTSGAYYGDTCIKDVEYRDDLDTLIITECTQTLYLSTRPE